VRAVNLIPADQRSGAAVGLGRSQGGAYAMLGVLALLALFAFLYGKAHHTISSSQGQIATINAQVQQAQADAGSLAPYETLNATREKRLKAVEQLMNSRFDWARTLHQFGQVLPAHVSLAALSGTVGSGASAASAAAGGSKAAAAPAAVTSATPPGSVPTFTLSGCAKTQDEVAETLERLRLIAGVKQVTLESSVNNGASSTTAASSASTGGCSGSSFAVAVAFAPLPPEGSYPAVKTVADPSAPTATQPTKPTRKRRTK